MNIVLCGGSGYIGTKLTEILFQETDYNITVIDRLDFRLDQNFKKNAITNPPLKKVIPICIS